MQYFLDIVYGDYAYITTYCTLKDSLLQLTKNKLNRNKRIQLHYEHKHSTNTLDYGALFF